MSILFTHEKNLNYIQKRKKTHLACPNFNILLFENNMSILPIIYCPWWTTWLTCYGKEVDQHTMVIRSLHGVRVHITNSKNTKVLSLLMTLTLLTSWYNFYMKVRSQLKEPKDVLIVSFLCTLLILKIYHI